MKSKFYIADQIELNSVINAVKQAKIVALDTEFTREDTYYPILSLIQIAIKNSSNQQESFIIDCLANLDLQELFTVIADSKIIKILHSAAQDLQIFYHQSNLIPKNIVDTQIMANFCGFNFNIGYSNIVEKLFNKRLNKDQQRSDWQRRPLSAKQLEYAISDVIFLEEIYENFSKILIKKQREDWFLEEMELFVNKILFRDEDELFKSFSFRDKNIIEISQIKRLILLRERWAKKINVPRRHFLKDETIEKIVVNKNYDLNFDQEVVTEIKEIFSNEVEVFERKNVFFMSQKQKDCYQEAKKLINKIAFKEDFKEQFLITSLDLKKIICDQSLFDKLVYGWRCQMFGKELKQLISRV